MTRCVICDSSMEEFRVDRRDGKIRPCKKCEDSILDCLDGFKKQEEGLGFCKDGPLAFADIMDSGIEDVTLYVTVIEENFDE